MARNDIVAIVPAAGLGKRFSNERGVKNKKTFFELDGRPIIIRTLEVLDRVPEIKEVIPAVRDEDRGPLERFLEEGGIKKVRRLAKGGKERQDSVWSALNLVPAGTSAVAIHDAVRPFATPQFISGLITALFEPGAMWNGVVPGLMPKDTIKERGENGSVKNTLIRDGLIAVQTPQIFLYEMLFRAYEAAMARGYYATDDSALIEQTSGGRVRIMPGLPENIKITTPEDGIIAGAIWKCRQG
ncbi:MAG: 2-C-methyl-D-erythritol 4-phosphate cytidylyltransferase [Nitrospiraceae bacterium]|nr:2-C-methyl-D-erythritol 4-phosphate cytidylyltransferase [Nitrospiraceae bacterium]